MAAIPPSIERRRLGAAILLGLALALADCGPAAAVGEDCTPATVAGLKRELAEKDKEIGVLTQRLRHMAQTNIEAIEKALSGTGIKVDRLIRRGRSANQGGPFIPADGPWSAAHRDIQRWDALSRVMRVLPMGTPLARYDIASGFGKRRDPINRRRAVHEGVDLVAPLRAPVTATGPGIVEFAGAKGRYGKVVEINHGMGVRTRYAHLGMIHVRAGQKLRAGQLVGLVGRTGRTTGPHLHYEVIVDGKPNNPVRFMKAGKRLAIRWGR